MTKKEKKAAYDKEYRAANKERIAARRKEYDHNNKDKKSAYDEVYRKENKGKISEYQSNYYGRNEDALKEYSRNYHNSKKMGYYIIYCLPNFDNTNDAYCGITQNYTKRMHQHKFNGKNTEGWFVLDVVRTEKEALSIERNYHDNGYKGKHKYKKQ